jgi:protoporphyrinogen IX oxidase
MDVLNNILLWLHLIALALGGVAAFGIPVVGSMMPTATPETRPTLVKIAERLSTIGRAGLGTLIVTGPLLVWLKAGGTAGFTGWFWAKMVLVVVLLGLVIFAGINAKRAQGGDMAAAKRAPQVGMASMATLILIVLTAVFAFN